MALDIGRRRLGQRNGVGNFIGPAARREAHRGAYDRKREQEKAREQPSGTLNHRITPSRMGQRFFEFIYRSGPGKVKTIQKRISIPDRSGGLRDFRRSMIYLVKPRRALVGGTLWLAADMAPRAIAPFFERSEKLSVDLCRATLGRLPWVESHVPFDPLPFSFAWRHRSRCLQVPSEFSQRSIRSPRFQAAARAAPKGRFKAA